MARPFLLLIFALTPVFASGCAGCTWQANSGSQAVEYTPGQGLAPANGPGFIDGEPLDMRGNRQD